MKTAQEAENDFGPEEKCPTGLVRKTSYEVMTKVQTFSCPCCTDGRLIIWVDGDTMKAEHHVNAPATTELVVPEEKP